MVNASVHVCSTALGLRTRQGAPSSGNCDLVNYEWEWSDDVDLARAAIKDIKTNQVNVYPGGMDS